jgi:hypothetical protein
VAILEKLKTNQNMKSYIKLIFAITIFILISPSCKKGVPENVVTTVEGYVIDSVKNKRLPNATVGIYGCVQTTFKVSCSELLATTKTDSNGEFKLSFNGDGKSFGFQAEVIYDENYDYSSKYRLIPGSTNTIVIKAREFSYLKTHLIITNNPFDTLINFASNVRHTFYGHTLDTTVMNRVLPNATNYIFYFAWDPNVLKNRRLIDTLQIGMQDTINYFRILPDVSTFPTD